MNDKKKIKIYYFLFCCISIDSIYHISTVRSKWVDAAISYELL